MRGACVVLAALALAGCASEPRAPLTSAGHRVEVALQEGVDVDLLLLGARTFDERCSPCHGEKGYGDGVLAEFLPIQPRNYHADPFRWGHRVADIAETVRQGRSGVMPAFEGALSDEETWAVAYFVWHWVPAERRQR